MYDFVKKLTFESDTFAEIKRDMTFVLQRLLANMQEKGSTEASMALKIDVSLVNEYIPNYDKNIEGESRKISKPKFKHKVTSAVQIKDEKSGNMDTEMELVYDENNGEYVMKPVANTRQMTIFDDDIQGNMTEKDESKMIPEERDHTGIPQLPGPIRGEKNTDDSSDRTLALPELLDDEVIDAEYKEAEDEENRDDISHEDIEDVTDELLNGEDRWGDYDYDDPEEEQ